MRATAEDYEGAPSTVDSVKHMVKSLSPSRKFIQSIMKNNYYLNALNKWLNPEKKSLLMKVSSTQSLKNA